MTSKTISDAVTNISEKYIEKADDYTVAKKVARKPIWLKWGAMAACLCLIVAVSLIVPYINQHENDNDLTGYYWLDKSEQMYVEIIEWQGEGFKAVVVDKGTSSIFSDNAKLTVFFEETSEVILTDGTEFAYNADTPNANDIGWKIGEIVCIEYSSYEDYQGDKPFCKRVYATRAELKTTQTE